MKPIITIDWETLPIEQRPAYPPEAVGVSILHDNMRGGYLAFGHPSRNNCDIQIAGVELMGAFQAACEGRCELLFFNMKFDLAVACEKWGLPLPPWDAVHDAMYLAFLHDPHVAGHT